MRALVIVHDPGSDPVLVGDRLRHHGFTLHEVMVTTEVGNPVGRADSGVLGDPTDYDLILPMGSNYSVYDTDAIGSWIGDELDFLRRADSADVPVFGICFGAQALAASLGGRVVRSEQQQVGWTPLTVDDSWGLPAGPWMQWHYDRFEPPTDATVIAEDHVGVQAFTVRRHLGVQFHPEVTDDHLQGWLDLGGAEELQRIGVDPAALMSDTAAIADDVAARTNRLVDWFLSDIAKL
jgi:GMP synthase-like glutamine amidotransferase